MAIQKGFWLAFGISILILLAGVVLLLQPSGQVSDFQKWQYPTSAQAATSSKLKVKFFGVSTLLFDDGQSQILIDGFFSRPSLSQVLFSKIQSQSKILKQVIDEYQLQRTQAILVTHSHYDHALDIAELGRQLSHTKIIGSSSTLNIARGGKVAEQQLIQVQPLHTLSFGEFKITAIASQHTPPTAVNNDLGEEINQPLQLPAHFSAFKEGHSFDYLIEHSGQHILVKASTGAVPDQLKNLQVDILFLGIAQLARQSEQFQQNYLDQTLRTLKPKVVIPIHWDNFFQAGNQPLEFLPYLADNTEQSLKILIQAAEQQHTRLVLLSQPVSYPLDPALQSNPSR